MISGERDSPVAAGNDLSVGTFGSSELKKSLGFVDGDIVGVLREEVACKAGSVGRANTLASNAAT